MNVSAMKVNEITKHKLRKIREIESKERNFINISDNVSLQVAVLGSIPLLQYLRSKDGIREHHIRHEEVVLEMKAITRLTEDLPLLRILLVQVNGVAGSYI